MSPTHRYSRFSSARFRGTWRRALAALSSMGLVLGLAVASGLGGGVANAAAETGSVTDRGVTATVTIDGTTYDGHQVVTPGSTINMRIDYGTLTDKGGVYVFSVSNNAAFTVDGAALAADNQAIESVDTSVPGQVTVKFKSNWGSTTSGQFEMSFTLNSVSNSELTDLEWSVGGQSTSIEIIVPKPGDVFAPTTESYSKAASPTSVNLETYFELVSGTVQPKAGADLSGDVITYTLIAQVDEPGSVAIADTLDSLLNLDGSSFTCGVVTWDGDGLNRQPSASCTIGDLTPASHSFTGTVTATGPSIYTITYRATIDSGIKSELQHFADEKGYLPGNFSQDLDNSATFNGGTAYPGTVTTTWSKPGVTLGNNGKSGNVSSLACVAYADNTVDATGCDDEEVTYTLTYWSNLTGGSPTTAVAVTDTLPKGMAYVTPLPTTATLSTWDTTDYTQNADTTPAITATPSGDGDTTAYGFSTSVPVPDGPAKFTIIYKAKITDVTKFEAALQASFDNLGDGTGDFSTTLQNTAKFSPAGQGSGTVHHTVTVKGTKTTGLDQSNAFGKTVDWQKWLVTSADGTLPENKDVIYTLTADLAGTPPTATHNVVIEDTLPNSSMGWKSVEAASTSVGITTLTAATGATCTATGFAGNSHIGQYCIDGLKLLVNVGKSAATQAQILATATIASLPDAGSTVGTPDYPDGTTKHDFVNTAVFHYGASGTQSKSATSTVYVRPTPGSDGWDVPSVFKKTVGISGEISVPENGTVNVPYTFAIGAGQGVNVAKSVITDYIDASIFDLPVDLSDVVTSAKYNGSALANPASLFDVTQDGDGNLLIAVKAGEDSHFNPVDKPFELTITLRTAPFVGKESKTITNKAILSGTDTQERYWSSVQAESTSFGAEAEVRKRIYDSSSAIDPWVANVTAPIGSDGKLQGNPFIYRLEFVAHKTYGQSGAVLTPVTDTLPAGMTFLSFVNESDIGGAGFDAAVSANKATTPMGANLEASYAAGVVSIKPDSGTTFQRDPGDSGYYAAYMVVEVDNSEVDIVNALGASSATITPVFGEVTWQKTDSSRQSLLGGSEWKITGPAGPDSSDVTVVDNGPSDQDPSDGQILVKPLVLGTYTLTETKAPTGYVLDSTPHSFVVDATNTDIDLGAIVNRKPSTGGGGDPSTSTSTSPTVTTTPTTAVTTATTVPPTIPTVTPSSATSPSTPPPPTNVPGTTIPVSPDECTDLVEHGFDPGETVTITVTGEHGQYELIAVADANGDVAFCLRADQPETLIIEVLGANHVVVREVVIGVEDLSYTGVPTVEYLTFALLLLGAGVALTLVGRRGRRGRHFAK